MKLYILWNYLVKQKSDEVFKLSDRRLQDHDNAKIANYNINDGVCMR